jgi:hypothetical protein
LLVFDPSAAVDIMTQGTRFIAIAIPLVIVYFLALFNVLPVPLLSSKVSDQILPVVRTALRLLAVAIKAQAC